MLACIETCYSNKCCPPSLRLTATKAYLPPVFYVGSSQPGPASCISLQDSGWRFSPIGMGCSHSKKNRTGRATPQLLQLLLRHGTGHSAHVPLAEKVNGQVQSQWDTVVCSSQRGQCRVTALREDLSQERGKQKKSKQNSIYDKYNKLNIIITKPSSWGHHRCPLSGSLSVHFQGCRS